MTVSPMRRILPCMVVLAAALPAPLNAQSAPAQQAQPQAPAQPGHRAAQKVPTAAPVGASDIFRALTQPDRPAELDALRQVRDTLNADPDAQALAAARAQLTGLVQAEERRAGDMPPALVMSGIATRIEAALAGLEERRNAASMPPLLQPPPVPLPWYWQELPPWLLPWLVPGLAALAAALAVALVACLAGLAARGRQDAAAEELQETLTRLRRKLEGSLAMVTGPGHGQILAETVGGEASEAVQHAAQAVTRLGGAARDAEGILRSSIEDAETRLHAAAAMAGQLERWVEALPERLAETVQAMEARGLDAIEQAAARLDSSMAPVAGLPELLAAYGSAVSGQTANAEACAQKLQSQTDLAGSRLEAAAAALPDMVNTAFRQALGELGCSADLMAELSNLAIGHAARLEDIIARTDKVAYDLPAVAQLLESASAHLLGQLGQDAKSSAALGAAAAALAALGQQAEATVSALPERLDQAACAVETRLVACAATVEERLGSSAGIVAEAAIGLPALQDGLKEVSTRLAGALAQESGSLIAAARALASECAALHAQDQNRTSSAERATDKAAATIESVDALADRLGGLTEQIESVLTQSTATRIEAEEAAAARAREADQVASLLEGLAGRAESCLAALPMEAAALAAAAAQLRGDAAELSAMAGAVAQAASNQMQLPAGFDDVVAAAVSASQRLEETLARLGEAGLALTDEAISIGHDARQMQSETAAAQEGIVGAARDAEAALRGAASVLDSLMARFTGLQPPGHVMPTEDIESDADLGARADRLAALLDRTEQLVDRVNDSTADVALGLVAAAGEAQAALRGMVETLDRSLARQSMEGSDGASRELAGVAGQEAMAAQAERLAHLVDRNERIAGQLLEAAADVAAAQARASEAAAEVVRLAGADTGRPDTQLALAGLNGLASMAETLQGEAETLAASLLRGETVRMPADLVSQTPVMLAAIETSIHRLRGTATALALASDAQRKAA